MNTYVKNVKTGLKFFSEALITQKSLAPNAMGKRWKGFYLLLDSRQVTNLKARDQKPTVPPALQRSVIPVDEEYMNSITF